MSQDSATSNAAAAAHDIKKTGIFAGVAVTCLVITGIVQFVTGPKKIENIGKLGEEFYPDFDDALKVTALDVFAWTEDAVAQTFRVEQQKNGHWVIPSHHSYPVDAHDQLADTASSVIGIKRGAMVTRWSDEHGKYGVVNPKQESLTASEIDGVGKRISLEDKKGKMLVDFIVGKEVEGRRGEYYVRRPDEDEVYITRLDINLTTKFTDWIESDLFEIQSSNVVSLTANNNIFEEDERGLALTEREVTALNRDKSADPWLTEGLDEEKEEINTQGVTEVLNTVSGLGVAGVRPKQPGLTPDLQLDREAIRSERDLQSLQVDLISKGFYLQPASEGDPQDLELLARQGELRVATNAGLVYAMFFGRVFTGSTEELEIGFGDKEEEQADKKKDAKKKDDKDADEGDEEEEGDDDDSADDEKNPAGRYVFVRVSFDKKYLGEERTEAVEPEMPAELKAAPAPKEGEEDPLKEVRTAYQDAQFKFQNDKRLYTEYVQKIADGIKKADELNARFAEWYYVVSGEEYDKLKLSRADYVQEKKEEGAGPLGPGGLPPNFPQIPGLSPGGITPGDTPPGPMPPNPGVDDGPKPPNPAVPEPEAEPAPEGETPE